MNAQVMRPSGVLVLRESAHSFLLCAGKAWERLSLRDWCKMFAQGLDAPVGRIIYYHHLNRLSRGLKTAKKVMGDLRPWTPEMIAHALKDMAQEVA